MFVKSLGGGTGSGFGSLIASRLDVEYWKSTKMGISVYSSDRSSTSVV